MKTLQIKLVSASKYKKGTRLLVKVKKEAFLGTVTATRQNEVYIVLDNEDKVKVKEKSKLILGEGIKRKVKKPISLDDIDKYIVGGKKSVSKPISTKTKLSKPSSNKTSVKKSIIATDVNIKRIVAREIKKLGNNADLNHIDTSKVTDMKSLFYKSPFNGDISKWDVSNVTTMKFMFLRSSFNGNISAWNVSNVKDMNYMFEDSKFNGDISKWDVSNVKTLTNIFNNSPLNLEDFKDSWKLKSLIQKKTTFKLPESKPNPKLATLWKKFENLDTEGYFELQYNVNSKLQIVSKRGDKVGGPAITILEKLGFKERVLFGNKDNNGAYGTMSKDNILAKIEFDNKHGSTTYYTFVKITEQ